VASMLIAFVPIALGLVMRFLAALGLSIRS
jgi:hypothetical protein